MTSDDDLNDDDDLNEKGICCWVCDLGCLKKVKAKLNGV